MKGSEKSGGGAWSAEGRKKKGERENKGKGKMGRKGKGRDGGEKSVKRRGRRRCVRRGRRGGQISNETRPSQ